MGNRGRPKKIPTARRDDQIVVYVHKVVGDALRREAEVRGVSVSTLAADIINEWVSSGGVKVNIPDETVYAVMRKLAVEGLLSEKILDAKFAPNSKSQSDGDSAETGGTEQQSSTPRKITSDKFAPKTSPPTQTDAKTEEQQGDESVVNAAPKTKRRGKGGEDSDT